MPKEDKPLEYHGRVRDTKGIAQRLDLEYLHRPMKMLLARRRLVWLALAIAAAATVPVVGGLGSGRRAVSNGPLSEAHAMFERRCAVCHTQSFGGVPDTACQQCHEGAAHPAKAMDTARLNSTPRCAECHEEHRGAVRLARVENGKCTSCHANLTAHAASVKLKGTSISTFRSGSHPEFSTASLKDTRPLRLNHAIHMPRDPKTLRGIKLPMQCVDCHAPDPNSPSGALLPVTFELNCKSCHGRELEFDVDHVLGTQTPPAPHTKDPKSTREFMEAAYRGALAADPALARRPVGNDVTPLPNAGAWLDRVVKDSQTYLIERKCGYCHLGDPMSAKAGSIASRFPTGEPWLARAEFPHRRHRALECESCHTNARSSTATADVLIPQMQSCVPCHGNSGTGLDRCSECHQYHNRSLEKNQQRRPTGELLGSGGSR